MKIKYGRIFGAMLLMFFIGSKSFGQTFKTLDSLEATYQACLDKGVNMIGCSKLYYQHMDSMLNLTYKSLRKKLPTSQFSSLKIQQLQWLSRRDKYFNNIPLDSEERALEKEDREMVTIDKKAEFIKERVIELMKKL